MTLDPAQQATREKRIAALASVGSAVLLLSLKIFLVARTGSLGVLSEAMHSGLDFLAAVITFLSVRVADKPADADHLYGHGKMRVFPLLSKPLCCFSPPSISFGKRSSACSFTPALCVPASSPSSSFVYAWAS